MQSQKSLANATKSIVKLMKVHDDRTNWSLADQNTNSTHKGSAKFLQTRLSTADPRKFRTSDSKSQFRIKRSAVTNE